MRNYPSSLKIPNLGAVKEWQLLVFTDASLANNKDCTTQAGYLVCLVKKLSGLFALITWKSHKLRRIARSTLSAETMACIDGMDAAILYQNLLEDVMGSIIPIIAVTDNVSLIESVYSMKSVQDKRLRVDLSYLKSLVDERKLHRIVWVSSNHQLADCLTKQSKTACESLKYCVRNGKLGEILGEIQKQTGEIDGD